MLQNKNNMEKYTQIIFERKRLTMSNLRNLPALKLYKTSFVF